MAKVPTAHVEVVNLFLNSRIPGIGAIDFSYFENDFEFSDKEFLIDSASISENFRHLKGTARSCFEGVIRSAMGAPKRNTLRCNLVTFENRNFVADRGCDVSSSPFVAQELVSDMIEAMFDAAKLYGSRHDKIGQNKVKLSEWVDKRTPMGWKGLIRSLGDFFYDRALMVKYALMVKADCKPKLDDTPLATYVTGQNIVYHDRKITAMFSHVFGQAVDRLKLCLSSRVVVYHGYDCEAFAKEVTDRIGNILPYHTYELDVSKYDKSQGGLMKDVERLVLLHLGVCEDVVDSFFTGEYDSLVSMMQNELVLSVDAQRRSGGANTWFGNTVVLLMLLTILLRDREPDLILLSGDDSLIFSREPLELDAMPLSVQYGFDVKLFDQCTPYFCSKYFVQTPDKLYFVPDPFKLLVKLGAKRLKDVDLLHEVFMSFVDLTKPYADEGVVQELVRLDSRRYGDNPHAYAAFCVIHVLRSNFSQFQRCFSRDEPVRRRKPDPPPVVKPIPLGTDRRGVSVRNDRRELSRNFDVP